ELAIASRDGRVFLWEPATDAVRAPLRHSDDAREVEFSPDGRLLVTAGYEGSLKVWDLQRLSAPPTTFPLGGGAVTALAFSPDGQQLAVAVHDRQLFLWTFRTSSSPVLLRGHSGFVKGLAFSPDGRRLAAGGSDRSVKVWDLTAPANP